MACPTHAVKDESESKRRKSETDERAVSPPLAVDGAGRPHESIAGGASAPADRAAVYEDDNRAPVYEDAGAGDGAERERDDAGAGRGALLVVSRSVQRGGTDSEPLLGGGDGHGHTETGFWGGDRRRQIRWIIAFSDVFTALAAGMTIKFFPLFFIDKEQGYSFSPVQLSVVYLLSPLVTAFLALLCRKLAEKISRPIVLLCAAAWTPVWTTHHQSHHLAPPSAGWTHLLSA